MPTIHPHLGVLVGNRVVGRPALKVVPLAQAGVMETLGDETKVTASRSGCLSIAFGMCGNTLSPPSTPDKPRTAVEVIQTLKRGHCYYGTHGALRTQAAAEVLGLRIDERIVDDTPEDQTDLASMTILQLASGGLVIGGVDYREGSSSGAVDKNGVKSLTDHFFVIHGSEQDGFQCIDSANGKAFELDAAFKRHDRQGWRISELILVSRRNEV